MECPREGRTGRPFAELVCGGRLDLAEAQRDISTDWIAAYKKYFQTDQPVR
jgi:hypothetical protein